MCEGGVDRRGEVAIAAEEQAPSASAPRERVVVHDAARVSGGQRGTQQISNASRMPAAQDRRVSPFKANAYSVV